MTADAPSRAQHRGVEIGSIVGELAFGATVTGTAGAAFAGMLLISGCVFFICTGLDDLGGSGSTVIRAVSFFGPGEIDPGWVVGMAAADATEGPDGGRGAGAGVDCGGKNVGADPGLAGATGGGVSGWAGDGGLGATPFAGGRAGKLIRTVSRL